MKKILFIGQLTDNSGYGNASRSYISTLSNLHQEGVIELSLLNLSFEERSSISDSEKDMIRKYSITDCGDFQPDDNINYFTEKNISKIEKYLKDNENEYYIVSLVVPNLYHIPSADENKLFFTHNGGPLMPKKQALNMKYVVKKAAGLYPCFVWEFDDLPKEWKLSINKVEDKIVKFISACSWNKEVIERVTPNTSTVVPYSSGNKISSDKAYDEKLKKALKGNYTFCMVGQMQERKGYDILLKAFLTEFKDEDVNLILKCYTNEVFSKDTKDTINIASSMISEIKSSITSYGSKVEEYKCNIIVVPGLVPEEKLSSIYEVSDCFVTCTRGEGFGIPLADFIVHYNKPVVSPDKGGHLDFLAPESPKILSTYEPYFSYPSKHHATCDMNYINPSVLSAKKNMRMMYELGNNSNKYRELCDTMHKYAKEYLSVENNIKMFKEALEV